MNKPTATEYSAAIIKGEQCRRSCGKITDNPHKHDSSERGRILSECWVSGFESVDASRKAGRR